MDEDGLFVVAFRCDDEAWDEVARTEVVKAGASGAFASESSEPRGGLDVVRHFSVLLPASVLEGPCGFAVYMKHGHAAPLASHRRLFRRCSTARGAGAAGRSRGAVLDVPLHREEQAQPDDDGTCPSRTGPRSRGGPRAARRPRRRPGGCCSAASTARASSRAAAPRPTRRHYHLRSAERDGAGVRYGHVVAAETIAVPAAAGDLPAALLGLLAAERRAATLRRRGAALDEAERRDVRATAAHAKHLGFRDGGLQKLVDRSEAYVDGGDAAASSTRRRARINEWRRCNLQMAGDRAAQACANAAGLAALEAHVARWRDIARARRRRGRRGRGRRGARGLGRGAPRRRRAGRRRRHAGQNVHVLLHSSDLLRDLAGSHAICCKSGKDRTAMAVTLEQTRALSRDLRVFDERMLCKLLRAHGVRRRNLLLNTGQDGAFNAVQVKSLPSATGPGGHLHGQRAHRRDPRRGVRR
ncbi:phosphatidylinositol-3,4-bisphosphate 4-phosphatase [Aureococcus anophagefferens]|nr:phosphatidylinositol-3,4-bisphosphate 4-phosphatase [Aureococcus anophagefferens]